MHITRSIMGRKKRCVSAAEERARQYRERNRIIREMGFTSYDDYLKSDLWADIRRRALARSSACRVCQGVATQVHHVKYRRVDLDGICTQYLVPLCRGCHKRIEFGGGGEKLSLTQVEARLCRLARGNRHPAKPKSV